MQDQRPKPPVPHDLDLRHFAFMPLHVQRLRDSDLVRAASKPAIAAALLLWCVAWHQVPAASLPNNDRILASFVNCTMEEWTLIREEALHGFVECRDGRLYHPVIVEQALEAGRRQMAGEKGAKARWSANQGKFAFENIGENAIALRSQCDPNAKTGTGTKTIDKDLDSTTTTPHAARAPPEEEAKAAKSRLKQAKSDVTMAIIAWNELAERHGLRKVLKTGGQREKKLTRAIMDCDGLEGWSAVLARVETIPFLLGHGPRGWKIDIDFLIEEKNLINLMEGFYDERSKGHVGKGATDPAFLKRLAESLKRSRAQ